jgi:hypothetical protein
MFLVRLKAVSATLQLVLHDVFAGNSAVFAATVLKELGYESKTTG